MSGELIDFARHIIEEDEADFERWYGLMMQRIGHLPLSEQLSVVADALEHVLAHHEELLGPEAGVEEAIAEARRAARAWRARGA